MRFFIFWLNDVRFGNSFMLNRHIGNFKAGLSPKNPNQALNPSRMYIIYGFMLTDVRFMSNHRVLWDTFDKFGLLCKHC